MPLPHDLRDRELQSYVETPVAPSGQPANPVAQRVVLVDSNGALLDNSDGALLVEQGQPAPVGQPWFFQMVSNDGQRVGAGLKMARNLSAGTTAAFMAAGPTQICGYYWSNVAAATRYLKLYDAPGPPGVAPTEAATPLITVPIFASTSANVLGLEGPRFASGIWIRATVGVADSDTTPTTANDVVVNLYVR